MMVWGELLALILRENLDIKSRLSQQLNHYHNQPNSRLRDSLKQVESFLKLRTPLRQVIDYFHQPILLEQSALPLAIYCFTVTPENFSVAVLRAATQTKSQLVTTLVGALAGAYNSCFGIPPTGSQL
ncbi:MAG: ADP-ribosylglycohydrolase family protein [cyanobacterium endosymbiont of Rhopalodia musculus]|uniref:ADP-ribosylglycohydrolase family protein n=1 Tax=cyanobacterium endosymbiont of Epithemia clementina EcSB TaxID=3034674 RepID=UPI002480AFE3|nr:ADP-ribosylglycohydrolase family protein [cyanobacterium endosymbiont of Epithemia clementina EcSB]WGT66902.1 ADP-ribosylglycohydrolase family protein [cyanobacterium endosymbiont of Epithemia clementina EcSB]